MPSLIYIVGQLADVLDKSGIARDREQPAANRKLDIEFWGIALAERSAGDVEASLKPVRREMQEIEPVAAPAGMTRIGTRQTLDQLGLIP